MSMFHKPIRRTFHRKSKNGVVKANGYKYYITQKGVPYSGDVTIQTHGSGHAHIKGEPFARLTIADKEKYREVWG